MAEVMAHMFVQNGWPIITGKDLYRFERFLLQKGISIDESVIKHYKNTLDDLFIEHPIAGVWSFWKDSFSPLLVIQYESKYYLGKVSVLYEPCRDVHVNSISFIDDQKKEFIQILWSMLHQADLELYAKFKTIPVNKKAAADIIKTSFDYCTNNKLYFKSRWDSSDDLFYKLAYSGKTLSEEIEQILAGLKK